MSDSNIHDKLVEVIENEDAPNYVKVIAVAIIETRKELCYLKKLNKWQIGLIVSLLLTTIAATIR